MADSERAGLISVRYRWTVLARILVIALLGIGLFALVTFLAFDRRLALSYAKDLAILSHLQEKLPSIIALTAFVQVMAVGGITLLGALIWTHAVSGPIVRVRRILASLATTETLESIRFRKTDQLHGLAEALQ